MIFKETAGIRKPNWDINGLLPTRRNKLGNPNVVMGTRPEPSALDWPRRLRFLEPDLNEEPTLLQARHQLESVFMTDNRSALEWEVCREKPNDFLGRPAAREHRTAAAPKIRRDPAA